MKQNIRTTSRLLFNEEPIVINRLAAKVLGLNEAIVVQQIHYWLDINRKAKKNIIDGRAWTYNTYTEWQEENFEFLSISTLKRVFKNLFDNEILIKGNFNKYKYDRTMWVTIDYDKLENILCDYENKLVAENTKIEENVEISTECQNDTMSDCNIVSNWYYAKCQNDTMESVNLISPIPEITTETTKETSFSSSTQNKNSCLAVETNQELIENNTNLTLDSQNKKDKVTKWDKERLLKTIEIYNKEDGVYFSFLEKIYKDDRNFIDKKVANVGPTNKSTKASIEAKKENNRHEENLEERIKKGQERKYRTDKAENTTRGNNDKNEDVVEDKDTRTFEEVLAEIKRIKSQENK